jgi:tetratricopeptide (TPR) repeat protein
MARPDSDKARVTVMRARQLLREKRYADALQVCADELARGSDDARLRLVAAHSLLAQGRHEGAKKEAQQVLRVDPAVAEAHRILADVACARGELATACDHLEKILALEPTDHRARQLLETLSRSSMSGGEETVPMPGAMQLSDRAASLERFIEDENAGVPDDRGLARSPRGDGPDLVVEDSFVEISDSMMEELPEPMSGKAGKPGNKRDGRDHDAVAGWMPAEPSGPQPPMTLSGLDALPPEANSEDAPTMPLLRPSAPKEPELKLDPRAARPVQQEETRRIPRSAEVQMPNDRDLAPPKGPSTEPISPSQIIDDDDDGFEDFEVEPASVPVSRGQKREIRKVRDPVQAREEHRAAAKPDNDSDAFVAQDDAAPAEGSGDLMSMFTGGPNDSGRDDDSISDFRTGRQQRAEPAVVVDPSGDDPFADDAFVAEGGDDAFVAQGGGFAADDAFVADDSGAFVADDSGAFVADDPGPPQDEPWDPMGDMETRARPKASPADLDDSLSGIGALAPPRKKKSRFKLVLVLLLLAGLGAGGGYGYYWYRINQFVAGEWQNARTALHLSTPAGYESARKAAKRILEKRPKNAGAIAALGMVDAALSIEFGLDRRGQAKKALDKTKGKDSEWRTAAQGFLALIDDPSSAVGYLQKGIEVFPKSALLRYLQGRALVASNKQQRGADAYQAALKVAPTFVSARLALASLIGLQDKGYDQAARMFDEVLKSHPGHIQALVDRARLRARHNKQLEAAIADMKRITSELASKAGRGQTGWAQLVLAQVYRRRGAIKEMSAALDAAVKSPPCCDASFRHELAGELMGLFRLRDAYGQQLAALGLNKAEPRFLQRAARLLLAMNRPDKAAEQLSKAPAGQPETKVLGARLKYAQRKYEDADGAFKPLLTSKKVATEAQLYHALTLAKLGKSKEALESLDKLMKAQPALDTAPLFAGRIHLWNRAYKKAEIALKKAWRINKLDPLTPTLLGHVSLATHDVGRAVKRFERALKSRPDYAPAHIALGHLLWQIGNLPSASARLGKVNEADRGLASYRALSARVAMAEKRFEAAEAALKQLASATPPKMLLTRLRGELALAQNKGKLAFTLLKKAQKADPKDAELLVLVGQAQMAAGKVDDAYDTFHAVLKVDAGQPMALLKLGRIAIRDGEYPLSVRRLKEALKQMKRRHLPKRMQAAAFTALGQAFLAKRDTGRALTNLQDAMELDPKAAEPQYRMGVTYDALDRPQRAVGFYGKAIAADPSYTAAYRRLGLALAKLNENAKAAAMLQKYIDKAPKARDAREIRRKIRKLQKSN